MAGTTAWLLSWDLFHLFRYTSGFQRILHMQAELLILEKELTTIVKEDRASGEPAREELDTC